MLNYGSLILLVLIPAICFSQQICLTPVGTCVLPIAGPIGFSCYCGTPVGPVNGFVMQNPQPQPYPQPQSYPQPQPYPQPTQPTQPKEPSDDSCKRYPDLC